MTAFAAQQVDQEARHNADGSDDGPAAAGPGAAAALPPAAAVAAWPSRNACLYTRCYCEENVWKLAHQLVHQLPSPWRLLAVFVSNSNQTVPLWRQRSAAAPGQPVVWDYHVFLLAQLAGHSALVLDLDSTLPFPCSLHEYRHAALLGDDSSLVPQYRRCYRVVPVRLFLRHFASDRTHMVGRGGNWLAPPPAWPCLVSESGATNTLPAYLDFSELGGAGAAGSVGVAAGNSGPEAPPGEQQVQRRQQQHAGGSQRHGSVPQDGNMAIPSEEGPPLGLVLREPAFLRLFGLGRAAGRDP